MTDRALHADAGRCVSPAATTAEMDAEIRTADQERLIVSLPGEDDMLRKLTDAGRLWLAEHP